MKNDLNYDPSKLPRELKRHYISASKSDIQEMLKELGLEKLEDLYADLPKDILHDGTNLPPELNYEELQKDLIEISEKNNSAISFIGDGLAQYKTPEITEYLSGIRGLTTAYTPYQPERSQGSLESSWIYSSAVSMLTGFEAINASFYDRATCLFEAFKCATKTVRRSDSVIVSAAIYPGDMEVVNTLAQDTTLKIIVAPLDLSSGQTDYKKLKELVASSDNLAGIAFPQVNSLGNLEDVDLLTDICQQSKIQSIAIIDPMLLGTGGLKPPASFGSDGSGANMLVGEGQHLIMGPSYGGPGLGIFAVRFNDKNKNSIRSTAGRYVGKGVDVNGNPCKTMVLSTREQHIRREKASSNICSNQSFMAALAGAGILSRGEKGMKESVARARVNALHAVEKFTAYKGVSLKFADTPFFNEFTVELPISAEELIDKAWATGIHLGVDVSERFDSETKNLLLVSLSDLHSDANIDGLDNILATVLEKDDSVSTPIEIEARYLRKDKVGLPDIDIEKLKKFYHDLGQQNVSPDDIIYPLGSCTMKYNPYINDWAAGLEGFVNAHPQAPEEDVQGSLQIGYQLQEIFKDMTGLAAVTVQPVAGAQGELVGVKMFQAYHRDRGEENQRNVILIPRSAHGTNPATATMAGFETKIVDGQKHGIVLIEADSNGRMDWQQLTEVVKEYSTRIAGIMVTNPNTGGIFEHRFKEMAELIHSVGGLVYMDGANMNAIAGWVDLGKLGVDAVHNNLHKTWSISHGGGGPGAAIVAVSDKLVDYLPGKQVIWIDQSYDLEKPKKSIGSFHRHFGNFAHNIRAYTYLRALGNDGLKRMSAVAVLSSKYLHHKLSKFYPILPIGADQVPRMHEFILTLSAESFEKIEKAGIPKVAVIARVGKLFLDYGLHAPTVAFPEVFGLMVEPTESFTKAELDRFIEVVMEIHILINEHPEVLNTVPHFTPVDRVDEVMANKKLQLCENLTSVLPLVTKNRVDPAELGEMSVVDISKKILEAHRAN